MTAQINVLVVMDMAADAVNYQPLAAEIAEAAEAVEELIDAAHGILDPHNPASVDARFARLRAAIAKATGAAP